MLGLELQGLRKAFGGQAVVNDVSLVVPQGKFVCFLGPSGCGKTTLLRMIAGLESPSSGRILMNGRDYTQKPVHERNFAMVFQALALFPHLTVEENIAYSLRMRGVDARERAERVAALIELIKLPGLGRRSVSALSGGQRQRVAIARALAQEPSLFLMDEPLSALDAKLRDHMQIELRLLQRKLKITTILVTHDQREAMTIADLLVVMGDGVVQQVGSPQDVYRNPVNRFVASFIGQSNLLEAEVVDHRHLRLAGQILDVPDVPASKQAGERVTLSVRPESVRIAQAGDRYANSMEGQVKFVRDVGDSIELRIDCSGEEIISTMGAPEWAGIGSPDTVSVRFPADACRVLIS